VSSLELNSSYELTSNYDLTFSYELSSIAQEVTMNPDNVNAGALQSLKELHAKLVL